MKYTILTDSLSGRELGKFTTEAAATKQALAYCLRDGPGECRFVVADQRVDFYREGVHLTVQPNRTREQYLSEAKAFTKPKVLRFTGKPSANGWITAYAEAKIDIDGIVKNLKLLPGHYGYAYVDHDRNVVSMAALPDYVDMHKKLGSPKTDSTTTAIKLYWHKFLEKDIPKEAAGLVIFVHQRNSGQGFGLTKRYVNGVPEPINPRR